MNMSKCKVLSIVTDVALRQIAFVVDTRCHGNPNKWSLVPSELTERLLYL